MPKIKQVLEEKQIRQIDFAEIFRLDEAEISRYVNGHNLPTVEKLTAFCEKLNCKPLDLYEKAEIDLLSVLKEEKEGTLEPHLYRLSVRIPREWCVGLEEMLKRCGYISITHWVKVCFGRLKSQNEILKKWEEKKNETARKADNEPKLGGNCKTNLSHNRKTAAGS